MKVLLGSVLAILGATSAIGQFAPPNDAGVSLGHIHLFVKDIEVQKRFFAEMMGGTALEGTANPTVQFPGVWILFRQAAETSGPPAGSIVNHFGFVFKDLPAMLAKWKAAGVEIQQNTNPMQGYVTAPDGVRIEFFGDPTSPVPVRMDHIHFFTTDIEGMQDWYSKVFGLVPGKRPRVSTPGWNDCVFVPGNINLSFQKSNMPMAPTKGRSLDHIGFEVRNIEAFVKKAEAQGIKFDIPLRQASATTKNAFLTDPWGTYIEITEHNLTAAK
jgi:catechol 2,3-dioxygenase-like lactoylglutathione lyase family enzyme